MDEQKIEIAKKEFKEKTDSFKLLIEYQEKFYDKFLKVKLGFLAFVGILLTIIFKDANKFSNKFITVFLIVIFLTFLLFIWDLRGNLWDLYEALKKQYKRTKLAKIRHIASLEESKFSNYGERAEELLIQDDEIRQAMYNKESITEIIKYKENIFWKIEFIIWALLFLSIPTLFLLEFLGIFL